LSLVIALSAVNAYWATESNGLDMQLVCMGTMESENLKGTPNGFGISDRVRSLALRHCTLHIKGNETCNDVLLESPTEWVSSSLSLLVDLGSDYVVVETL